MHTVHRISVLAGVACALALSPLAQANTAKPADRAAVSKTRLVRPATRPQPAPALPSRLNIPVMTVQSTGPGQAGYVHYFVITGPDGQAINHVAVELEGNRIVSSFPDDGVSVTPFVRNGAITTSAGNVYDIEHLYGIRPFADDAAMRTLQRDLDTRVQAWLGTPYCDELTPARELCVSCLSLAMSVLYPERLPPDFKGAQKNVYTTEDLLMYLAGVPVDAPRETRSKRIATLAVPVSFRDDLVRISGEIDATRAAETATPQRRTVDLPKRVLSRRRS
jgi:hypothetical protein